MSAQKGALQRGGKLQPGQWRLQRVEVLNWGTFQGHHAVEVARKGFLLTGHSGSGKSSLVDAISAVLTPRGKLRFNAAAQDTSARGEDRSLASYVRGAWRRSAHDETGEVSSDYLRPGATFSAILLRYGNGIAGDKPILLIKLYHLRRGSNTTADVSELSLLLNEEAALPDFVEHLRSGIETRRIKAAWPQALTVTDKHSAFASKFCRVLGISGENGVLLLHKTQSAKSLGSLDDLFRSFMLDRPKTFDLADNAVTQFSELSEAHRLVVEARNQVSLLEKLESPVAVFEENTALAAEADIYGTALPTFKDAWRLQLAREACAAADALVRSSKHSSELAAAKVAELAEAHALAQRQVDKQGGDALKTQRAWIDVAKDQERVIRLRRAEIEARLTDVGIDFPGTFEDFSELRATLSQEQSGYTATKEASDQNILAIHEKLATSKGRVRSLEAELKSLHLRRSNLEDRLIRARDLVAKSAGLPASAFPFAGELMEVRKEFADWSGAIERVLRPLATVMLVPQAHLAKVREAVDGMNLGTRLVFEAIPLRSEAPRTAGSERSLIRRVEVAPGLMAPWLNSMLSRSYDYECVDSPAELGNSSAAVTRAGQVKRSATRHEKDDRSRVDDRSRWVLGFDNQEKIEHLTALAQTARAEEARLRRELDARQGELEAAKNRIQALTALHDSDWADVDTTAAAELRQSREESLAQLLASSGDLRLAESAAAEALLRVGAAKKAEDVCRNEAAAASAVLLGISTVIDELTSSVDFSHPTPAHIAQALEHRFYAVRRNITHDRIDGIAMTVAGHLSAEEKRATATADKARTAFAAIAGEFSRQWKAKAADLQPMIEDREGYLRVLAELRSDRLPDFENRFFELLERQSQQNVAQLANEIRRAPAEVRERISPVNTSLGRSVFDEGRFLKIAVKENRTEAGRKFLADLQTISAGSWVEQEHGAAEAKFEVMRRMMERLASSEVADTSWRNQCLDTRLHVRFTATEIDPEGQIVNVHDSSAGLSGGQRQKLVTFCLAAALRYQLADEDTDIPSYGTVIMDEAFDKADSNFTRMAMDIFTEFGFHMVLATPLKLLQTLEEYIGGMAVVTCRDFQDSRIGSVSIEGTSPASSTTPDERLAPVAVAAAVLASGHGQLF
ncbi:SbcC/MukB-like Walker B domain-containing protein [Arthrobacter sp. LAPM80]|uniref:ATP-binding protein n=1 Tax=Arthrobacter sp. LAPM80 TaxID=3141788 RepID=UPI00398B4FA4